MIKKILIIGDYETSHWHTFKGVDEQLTKILSGNAIDIKCTDEYSCLTLEELNKYNLLICYVDAWATRGSKQTTGAILSYIAGGGSLLTLHSGIITRSTPELELLHGGRFTGHPEACNLTYTPADSKHLIMQGIEPFTIFEEPYRFTMANLAERELLLTYSHEGQDYPAAWTLSYGMGKVVYLSIGHTAKSFESEMFGKLILNSIEWCTSDKE